MLVMMLQEERRRRLGTGRGIEVRPRGGTEIE
jgi:hypothetical protein